MLSSKKSGGLGKPCEALSEIFDEPHTLADRLRRRDSRVILALEDVATVLSAETVGFGVKERFAGLTDQQAGKLLKALLHHVSDARLGGSMKTIFAACLEELRRD